MLTSIVGTNWGDEGKGRMVDLSVKSMILLSVIKGETTQGIQ